MFKKNYYNQITDDNRSAVFDKVCKEYHLVWKTVKNHKKVSLKCLLCGKIINNINKYGDIIKHMNVDVDKTAVRKYLI